MSNLKDRAVILAAGLGSRLRPRTNDLPKTLLPVRQDKTILDLILDALEQANYSEVVVVTGYLHQKIEDYLEDEERFDIEFVHSERYDETNNLYSLFLAEKYLRGGFTLINSDTVFSGEDLSKIEPGESSMLVESKDEFVGEEMMVSIDQEEIMSLGKDIDGDAEYIGVCAFNEKDTKILINILKETVDQGLVREWYEKAINEITSQINLIPKEVERDWIEVDNEKDYQKAKSVAKEI